VFKVNKRFINIWIWIELKLKFEFALNFYYRDHLLCGLIPLIVQTPITTQFYEQSAFIRHSSKVSYLVELIRSLKDFQFDYEQSLTLGLVFW